MASLAESDAPVDQGGASAWITILKCLGVALVFWVLFLLKGWLDEVEGFALLAATSLGQTLAVLVVSNLIAVMPHVFWRRIIVKASPNIPMALTVGCALGYLCTLIR